MPPFLHLQHRNFKERKECRRGPKSLQSGNEGRSAEGLRMMEAAGFSDVWILKNVQKKVFKRKRYEEYGWLKRTFLISGVKREQMPPLIPC
ncbi:hypothetical protein AUQ37_01220 [Candidatus Methanomethylophilus sp. 1R26]|nr:hypothetical protein AUQ37_01220 [Candidatus Methanomethylophilus sp. 1R26]TQS78899.1 MAG: hypothetical protein A3Q59_00890 [Methanomethylophilus alvi]